MMKLLLLLAASCVLHAAAFQVNLPSRHASITPMGLFSSSSGSSGSSTDTATTTTVPIIIDGRNIEVTPALEEYVNKRIGGTLNKLSSNGAIRECDVILSVSKNPKVKNGHRVEVLTSVKGTSIVCNNESGDMYASIDAAAHALTRKLRKYKERRTEGWHGGANMGKDLLAALESLDDVELPPSPADDIDGFVDPEAKAITKINSFDLSKPMSVEEAVFALDYVDHDFYVFKNEANSKITVVYKRNVGGIGLIEPE